MARESVSVIGSGTLVHSRPILTPAQRGTEPVGRGERYATNVTVVNPEDLNSVDAWAVSGITVGTTAVEIVGPGSNLLPRMREVTVQNLGPGLVYLGNSSAVTPFEGYQLQPSGTAQQLPLLHNNSVWGITDVGLSDVRIVIL